MKQTTIAVLAAVLLLAAGCGGPKPAAAVKADTTAACCDSGTCDSCAGSDSVGAVCDTALDTTAVKARTAAAEKPSAETKPATQKAAALPRLWDFGSVTCIPCKTMKEILDPMMADYRDKVDVRIINVYEEKELARQFRIVTIPTQVFIDAAGKELFRHIGVYPRDSIETCFRKFGFPVVKGASPQPATGATGGT